MISEKNFPETVWHAKAADESIRLLESSIEGLSESEANERLEAFGINALPSAQRPSLGSIILKQLANPLIYILLIAGVFSIIIKDYKDAVFILAVVALNSIIGTFQEWNAEKSAATLQDLIKVSARVRRDGIEAKIDAEQLVPGDIVILESGDRVPADMRMQRASQLLIDESLLTGESVAVNKKTESLEESTPESDRLNMAYAGTTVAAGRGTGVVVATGSNTQVGRIAETVAFSESAKPPLLIRMEIFAKHVSIVAIGASLLFAFIAILRGIEGSEIFMMAVALMVSAIPEGLPVAITVVLSIGTRRMVSRHVIVRELSAIESLGSCTCIATDKTGTLTWNEQSVKKLYLTNGDTWNVTGEGYSGDGEVVPEEEGDLRDSPSYDAAKALAKEAVICNDAGLSIQHGEWKHQGDVVDVALLAMAMKTGIEPEIIRRETEVVGEIPFESERRYAAAFYKENGHVQVAVKGALETLIEKCNLMETDEGPAEIRDEDIKSKALELAEQGYRVIAVANGRFDESSEREIYDEESLPPLKLLGIVGMIDPLRPDVKEAVDKCHAAGIKVIMITGDHPATALAIAREVGIPAKQSEVITGSMLTGIEDVDIPHVENTRVFARVTPIQKLEIVEDLIKAGHFVAVTGDGVNDAPALKRANIGVAMGSGTDVAKEASQIIITDDDFSSIESGIEEGRFAYDNIRKVVYLLLSTGIAEVFLFIASVSFGYPLALLPAQILWLNLVTNGIQDIGLAFEAGEPSAMKKPPRDPDEGIFNRRMIEQCSLAGLWVGIVAFSCWIFFMESGWDEAKARNMVLLLMVLFENVHVFNCRSEFESTFKISVKRNLFLIAAVIGAQAIHISAMYIPFMQSVLEVAPVSLHEWSIMLLIALSLLILIEIYKIFRKPSYLRN